MGTKADKSCANKSAQVWKTQIPKKLN